ncbi:hypothetical protein APUTEX25_004054 [Auxenochlorella protothecoides]|uniref:ABC1 atypical kinase-like domain-containing protein n=1 Tax=Auxenochlorella protothecoides TaxID=3075 RepID=A0A3M7L5H8_AUXPR|nr:hypothetical protein APUTEX25_004054 [Auxenochlorella protothecoides]|eukprot:RMZ57220.1 hypothetical protein APUTEX25_004054 [Auxenochlorella protothecoides]
MRRFAILAEQASKSRIASGACAETSGRALLGRAGLADGAPRSVADLEQVPTLVRSIWGRGCEGVLAGLRPGQAAARQLVRRWEDAELRLIAVANSLASKSGQKVLAVGIPLAAAQLMGLGREARAYAVPLEAQGEASSHHPRKPAGGTGADALHAARRLALCLLAAVAREALLAARAAFLGLLFLPALLSSPALCGRPPAPDIFPADACAALASLQAGAPAHAFAHTRATVEASLGAPLERLFVRFDPEPVASGSIAQVHRAVLSTEGAAAAAPPRDGKARPVGARRGKPSPFAPGAVVAVKVRHPAVCDLIERDITLMRRAARLLELLGTGGQLRESVMQFGAPLREQLDLRQEAAHLQRFAANFSGWRGVRFPLPAGPGLVAPDVLVETFEGGQLIARFLETEGARFNKRLAGLGLACYLKMLLRDNFLHADMHPGNIMVDLERPGPSTCLGALAAWTGWDLRLPRLVLLDVGMTARLTPADQGRLVAFFGNLTRLDGRGLADAIVSFSDAPPPPRAAAAFRADLGSLFDGLDAEALRADTAGVVAGLMDAIRRHGVQLQGVVSTVVITTCVLEGWSTQLDPGIRMMESLRDILPSAWGERAGRALDSAFTKSSLAMAVAS